VSSSEAAGPCSAVVLRHVMKTMMRVPPLCMFLLGHQWGKFHGYTLTQGLSMMCGPTVMSTLLAVKSTRALLALAGGGE